jgi:gliding motility-associated-like protein
VKASVDLVNVSVESNNQIVVTWNTFTDNFKEEYFLKYEISRSLFPTTNYSVLDSVFTISDTIYIDQSVNVLDNVYNYMVEVKLVPFLLLSPVSDSIQSVLLSYSQNSPDTNIVDLFWTPYWGWQSPIYELLQSVNNGPWEEIYSTTSLGSGYTYNKSLLASNYRLMVRVKDGASNLLAYSNWVDLDVVHKQIPNIITPNGDGINDFFFVNQRLVYQGVHLIVYSRWGARVYEDENYENDWNGDNYFGKPLSEGTYFYVIMFGNGNQVTGHLSILREGK